MNIKTNKDILIRTVKNFLCLTALVNMLLLIFSMLFGESIVFSKEILALLICIAIFCFGIGGLTCSLYILFSCCLSQIANQKKTIAKLNRIIHNQNLEEETLPINPGNEDSKENDKNKGQSIINEIIHLSDDDDNTVELESSDQEVSTVSEEKNSV